MKLLFLIVLLLCGIAQGATWNAASPALAHVQAAYNSASSGDTVLVPAGNAIWTSTLNVSKNITLQGAGEGSTIITNGIAGGTSRQPLLKISLVVNLPFRLTGFTFAGGAGQTRTFNAEVRLGGTCHMARIDHCTFQSLNGTSLGITGFTWGVIDHNTFNCIYSHPITIEHDAWNGYLHGHGSYADAATWGSERFLFIENNTIDEGGGIDSFEGARFVFRYNMLHNCGLVAHGTEGQGRGMKQIEEYGNTYNFDSLDAAGQIRAGSIVTFSNTWVNVGSGHVLQVFRPFDISPHFGPANGQNLWDKNVTNAVLGLGYWATGTHTGTNGSLNLVDSNAGKIWYNNGGIIQTGAWATDRWFEAGYVYPVRNVTQEPAPGNVRTYCVGNSANVATVTTLRREASYTRVTFNTGDTYQIWKVQQALDQPGMGQSDLLTGLGNWNTGVNLTTPYADPNQVQEPCYSWANNKNLASTQPNILLGRDYFNNTVKPGYTPYIYPHPLVGTNNPVQLAAALQFGQQPTTTAVSDTITPPITVRIVDSNGNLVATNSTVTMAVGAGSGSLSGTIARAAINGTATFNDLSINVAGNGYTLVATSPGLTNTTSTSFNITSSVGIPSQLVMAQQPSSTTEDVVISPSITVKICDVNGTQTTSTANVTVSIGTNPSGGVLSGTLVVAAVSGLATFSTLSIDNVGAGYTLHFVSGALTDTDSDPFNITLSPPPPLTLPKAPRGLGSILILTP